MKHPDPTLATPLFVKGSANEAWPIESCFHLLTRDGLFLCRNNEFFSSCVPAPRPPSSLANQHMFLRVRYPLLPRRQYEIIVGFFTRIAQLYQSEACVLLAWDPHARRYELIVPEQIATVSGSSRDSRRVPIGLHYKFDPQKLPANWIIVGSVHSHVDEGAHSSGVDAEDERHRPGLHIIIGRISDEVPEVRVQGVVDGIRFRLDPTIVIEDFRQRRMNVPREWIDRVKVEQWKPKPYFTTQASFVPQPWSDR